MLLSDADDPLSDDAITADYRIWQRVRGHRYSLDDVLTAWVAARRAPGSRRILDLGSGIGSVALMLAWKLREASLTTIEAQEISFALQEKNLERNGLDARIAAILGDFRVPEVLARAGGPFDLVTGTPPYFAADAVLVSTDSQRAHARVELRGGVEAYLAAARASLADGGVIVVCGDAKRPERVTRAAETLGLSCEEELRAYPREGKDALFSVWTLTLGPSRAPRVHSFVARTADGARTSAQHEIRGFFGLSIDDEPASPPTRPRRTGASA